MIDQASHAFFTIIGWVMRLAPLGAFGAMAYIIGQYGIASLASYGKADRRLLYRGHAVHPGARPAS